MARLRIGIRSGSLSRLRIVSGLLTLGLALGLVGTQLAGGLTAEGATPKLTLSPTSGPPGTTVTVRASGFPVRDDGWVFWDGDNAGMPEVMSNRNGGFITTFQVPEATAGQHTVKVVITGVTVRVPFAVTGSGSTRPQPQQPSTQPQRPAPTPQRPAPTPQRPQAPAQQPAPAPAPSSPAQVVWQADMETGNLGQWTAGNTYGGSYDSGNCQRPSNGVSTEQAHTGRYSMKMTIDTSNGQSGCRQFRHEESVKGGEYYYSAWMLIPKQVSVSNFWNFFQFKSSNSSINETTWVIEAKNRPNGNLHAVLRWKGLVAGPYSGEGTALRYYDQAVKDIPIGRWFHVEFFLRQSESYSGRVTVWQDGVQLWDMNNVKTRYPNADQRWSINSYSDGLSGNVGTLYVDDAKISRTRVGPN